MKRKNTIIIATVTLLAAVISVAVACSADSSHRAPAEPTAASQTKLNPNAVQLATLTFQYWWLSNNAFDQNPSGFMAACYTEDIDYLNTFIGFDSRLMDDWETYLDNEALTAYPLSSNPNLSGICPTCQSNLLSNYGAKIASINAMLPDIEDMGDTISPSKILPYMDSCLALCQYQLYYQNEYRLDCYLNCIMSRLERHYNSILYDMEP